MKQREEESKVTEITPEEEAKLAIEEEEKSLQEPETIEEVKQAEPEPEVINENEKLTKDLNESIRKLVDFAFYQRSEPAESEMDIKDLLMSM